MEYTIPEDAILTYGGHENGKGTCARELLHMIVCGFHADMTPYCLTAFIDAFPALNDCCGWRDNEHRTSVFLAYFPRIMQCKRDAVIDKKIGDELSIAISHHFGYPCDNSDAAVILANFVSWKILERRQKGMKPIALQKETEECIRLFLETICNNYGA